MRNKDPRALAKRALHGLVDLFASMVDHAARNLVHKDNLCLELHMMEDGTGDVKKLLLACGKRHLLKGSLQSAFVV